MEWIKVENNMVLENEVIGLSYLPSRIDDDDDHEWAASLSIYLRGGAQMKITGSDATEIWNQFQKDDKANSTDLGLLVNGIKESNS